MEQKENDLFVEGANHYFMGKSPDDNPFDLNKEADKWHLWLAGWRTAYKSTCTIKGYEQPNPNGGLYPIPPAVEEPPKSLLHKLILIKDKIKVIFLSLLFFVFMAFAVMVGFFVNYVKKIMKKA